MATIILSAVGTAIGGPVGGAVGSLLGQVVDRRIFSPKGRSGPRLGDLTVQSSAYGQPIARLYGTMRVAGSVIWATDISETSHTSGGGKKSGGRTTSYSYSASFAVALSARRLQGIGRIWGDGKLLRNSAGEWLSPAAMRFYAGDEDQPVDPLIASAEGIGTTPAYRGLAYVVFEDMQLAAFANHIPSLSFEVIADDGAVSEAAIVADLFAVAGADVADGGGLDRQWPGLGYSGGTLRGALELLGSVGPLAPADDGTMLRLKHGGAIAAVLADRDMGARGEQARRGQRREIQSVPADRLPGEIALSYYDVERDYQAGLQRARRGGEGRGGGARIDQIELTAAIDAGTAKALAEKALAAGWARRSSAKVKLPWRHLALRPGDLVRLPGDDSVWKIRGTTVERMTIELSLDRAAAAGLPDRRAADGGRAQAQPDAPHGPTLLHVLDLPPLFESLPATPRLWLATAGTLPGWRTAELSASTDGRTWQGIGVANGTSAMGMAVTGLAPAAPELLDLATSVEVVLAHDRMLLQGCSDAAMFAGANLGLLGDELLQFGVVEAIGPARYRLRRLLRGRRGTETAVGSHAPGERFVVLDPALLTPFDPPPEWLGASLSLRAAGPGDPPTALPAASVTLEGRALLPLSPVHLRAARLGDGTIRIQWHRRSRQGWGWAGGSDAPLAEQDERYRLRVIAGGGMPRTVGTTTARYDYSAGDQIADCGTLATALTVEAAQLSAVAGPGLSASKSLFIPLIS